ncbi:MAG: hypothetical protein RLZZ587_798, partial [Actinomycetota bacterium]
AQVGAYLGEGKRAGKVSDLAYHNSLMVQIWGAIASKDAQMLERSMSRFGALPSTTAWGVYLRCHDDIGWAIDDSDAASLGVSGHGHRMFLADYFTGKFPGSDARGVDFQIDPASGERRTSGSAASLTGIETALATKNKAHLETAIARYLCAYSMVFGFGGIPLLYMGDEIGMINDESFVKDPAKAEDNRWIHRPAMDWATADKAPAKPAESASVTTVVAHRIRTGIQHLIDVRGSLPSLHASVATVVRAGRSHGVAIFERNHPAGRMVQVYNLADAERFVDKDELGGLVGQIHDHITGHTFELGSGIPLAPYEVRWLTVGA